MTMNRIILGGIWRAFVVVLVATNATLIVHDSRRATVSESVNIIVIGSDVRQIKRTIASCPVRLQR